MPPPIPCPTARSNLPASPASLFSFSVFSDPPFYLRSSIFTCSGSCSTLPLSHSSRVSYFLSLPHHTQCPRPLLHPRHVRVRHDPFSRCTPLPIESSLLPYPGDDWSLHPLIVSQVKSVRPEDSSRCYVDWFSSPSTQVCRLAKTSSDSAWSYLWSPNVWSWINPPPHACDLAVKKFFRDRGRGTFIVPAITSAPWFLLLRSFATLSFMVHISLSRDAPSSDIRIFIIDDSTTTPPSSSTPRTLIVHHDSRSALRHSRSKFISSAWFSALSLHPNDDTVFTLCDGITWGHPLGYHGDRLTPRFCNNTTKALHYASALNDKISLEYEAGYRSGPFSLSPPFFNIICNPRSAAIKKHSGSIRLVINMSHPMTGLQ